MMRAQSLLVVLIVLLVAAASCHSTSKSNPSPTQTTYHLKCGSMVPPDLARQIESKPLHEGRNELAVFDTGRLYADITNAQMGSLVLEVKGQKPTVVPIARMPDPPPNPGDETPMGCDQKKDVCIEHCNSATDPRCCKCECLLNWIICKGPRSAGGMSGGITIF